MHLSNISKNAYHVVVLVCSIYIFLCRSALLAMVRTDNTRAGLEVPSPPLHTSLPIKVLLYQVCGLQQF